MGDRPIDASKLRRIITSHFSLDELQTLCSDMGIDYEELPADGIDVFTRELIRYCQRRDRLLEMIRECAERRPAANWPATIRGATVDYSRPTLRALAKTWLADPYQFSRFVTRRELRRYQREPARAILRSILNGEGHQFAVMMSRQAGKNELSGQMEAYLLNLYRRRGGQIVKASPTFKPQTINSILRLLERLDNPWNLGEARRREGYIVQLERARTVFFSADPHANVVGATADLLLEADEAQDVDQVKWDRDFAPMGASTNVTTVFWGTAWTSRTLLAQRCAYLRELERKDGVKRVFTYDADVVAAEVPAYGRYIESEIERLGRDHPIIRTQYYLEEIDSEGGLFPAQRQALMRGDHQRLHGPDANATGRGASGGHRYAILIDVAGEDEQNAPIGRAGDALDRSMLANVKRDATALTVVDVEVEYGKLPVYRVVDRRFWLGVKHTSLQQQITAIANHWHAVWIVIDATGVWGEPAYDGCLARGHSDLLQSRWR